VGYIQHYLKTEKEIPNQSAARIFAAATSILKAGIPGRAATRLPDARPGISPNEPTSHSLARATSFWYRESVLSAAKKGLWSRP